MDVRLLRASVDDADEIHAMQVEAFRELLEKYQDYDTNPGNESMEKVAGRLRQEFTFYYFICVGQRKVGAVRIVDRKEAGVNKRISPSSFCRNFRGRALPRKQFCCVRKCMERTTGSWTPFCRSRETVIYTRRWDMAEPAGRRKSTRSSRWYFTRRRGFLYNSK